MSNLFERKKIDGSAIRNIKELITIQFKLSENTTLAVAELRCHEPGCPPEETVITARHAVSYTHLTLPTIYSV